MIYFFDKLEVVHTNIFKTRKLQPARHSVFSFALLASFLITLASCSGNSGSKSADEGKNIIKYAENVRITDYCGYRRVQVLEPDNSGNLICDYLLLPDSVEMADCKLDIIRIPIKSVVCFSSTQLSMMGDNYEKVVGILESQYVRNPIYRSRLDSGLVKDVGLETNYDVERIISLNPDILLYSSYTGVNIDPLKKCNTVLFPWSDFFEQHPLGRSEWLRVMGCLLDRQEEYDSLFHNIEQRYNNLKSLCANVDTRPTVFSDMAYSNQWYVAGGRSYIARIFADAGADYIWKDDLSKGSFPLSAENIIAKASDADYWRINNSTDKPLNYDLLLKQNRLYGKFKAFQNHNILVCDVINTMYYETSVLHPDMLLADFIFHFHPEVLAGEWAGYSPTYYKKLDL